MLNSLYTFSVWLILGFLSVFCYEHSAVAAPLVASFDLHNLKLVGIIALGSINLPNLYVSQFATNIQLLLQQTKSKLRGHIMEGSYVGKQGSPVDQIGSVEMQPVTGRFAPIGRVDAAVDRRWVYPSDYDLNQLIDSFDKLKMLTDPKSAYVQNAVAAANRKFDQLVIAALAGTAKTGETGGNSVVRTSGNDIAVNFGASADCGLTVAKLKEAKRKLMLNQVDLESDELVCIVNAQTHDNLLAETQIINTDYNDRPVLVDGIVKRFLGINFIYCEQLQFDATDTDAYLVPVFAKSGMHLGIWNDVSTDIDKRKDLQGHPWQAYVYMSAGATRLEEKKVMHILCE